MTLSLNKSKTFAIEAPKNIFFIQGEVLETFLLLSTLKSMHFGLDQTNSFYATFLSFRKNPLIKIFDFDN